jgi:hypothetical protein
MSPGSPGSEGVHGSGNVRDSGYSSGYSSGTGTGNGTGNGSLSGSWSGSPSSKLCEQLPSWWDRAEELRRPAEEWDHGKPKH